MNKIPLAILLDKIKYFFKNVSYLQIFSFIIFLLIIKILFIEKEIRDLKNMQTSIASINAYNMQTIDKNGKKTIVNKNNIAVSKDGKTVLVLPNNLNPNSDEFTPNK